MSKYARVKKSKDEWMTPRELVEKLGVFDLDPCAPPPTQAPWRHSRKCFWHPDYDGLKEEWSGRVWLNPPYLKQAAWPWVAKLAEHGSGICLLNSTTDTAGFQEYVLAAAYSVLFIKGRISFFHLDGTPSGMPMQGSVLAAYSKADSNALYASKIPGEIR